MIRALIVDDSPTLRGLLRNILESDPELQVVGEARTGEDAVAFCARTGAPSRTVERIANTEGFEELQAILAGLEDAEAEARHLRSTVAALRNHPSPGGHRR